MPTGRSSVPSASAEGLGGRHPGRSSARLALLAALLLTPGFLHAQRPVLRVAGEAPHAAEGVLLNGSVAFPASVLQRLGFRLAATPGAMTAVLGGDTVTFWMTSPFFRAGGRVHQLAFPVGLAGADVHIPEQFFIQWLPAAYPARFEFRGGEVVARTPAPAGGAVPGAAPPASRRTLDRTRVVVLDPGHGGPDPGKIGPNGLREKDVTLLISQRLAAVLRDRGYEVHLTRTTDTLIALADRPRLANQWRGERPVAVFISIHANSAPSTAARGFETFFLSEARTEDERRVAEMENAAIRFEDDPVVPTGNGLDRILNNLRSDFLMRASHDLAAAMQEKMAVFHPGPNRGVKRAGFYVLVGAIMPAVLVETAFISNRGEADLLGTQAFQQKVAWGMADAVDVFFHRNEHLWMDGS
jgi:N-acetylmuramoyl-L-alanine amidase